MLIKQIAVALVLATIVPMALAAEQKSRAELGTDLAHALSEQMVATYACQTYLGGSSQYRLAKLQAIDIYVAITGDRNRAVLQIDKVEQQIKATNADTRMVANFDKMKLSYVDRVGTCQDLVAQAQDSVQHIQAELGMLK